MYNNYFGLQDSPFSIAPNPHYLYLSPRHREALAHLMYGIKSDGGFILLTGEVGTGKTTVCRCLLAQIPGDVDIALILNPKMTALEMLATICDELSIDYQDSASIKTLVDNLNEVLLRSHQQGRKTILIIDEAQNLSVDVLEQLRLLTNLETNQRKLLQIILLGQPELLTLLDRQELRQLSQRVTARFHLGALNRKEVSAYIAHRLNVAGSHRVLFPEPSINLVFEISLGIPRVINLICDRSLLGAYVEEQVQVSRAIVNKAATEVLGDSRAGTASRRQHRAFIAGIALLVFASVTLLVLLNYQPETLDSTVDTTGNSLQQGLPSTRLSPPPTPLLGRMNALRGASTPELALGELLSAWGYSNEPTTQKISCELIEQFGLACFSGTGDLQNLINMNRPAAINLGDSDRANWITLIALSDNLNASLETEVGNGATRAVVKENMAQIRVNDSQQWIDQAALTATGEHSFILMWRMPANDYRQPLTLGDTGASVDWLVSRLTQIESNKTILEAGYIFDLNLERRVKAFQLAAGITPSGIAGPRTFIALTKTTAGVPRLRARGQP
ncbi:MAG: general secretion pathway protein A [Candidatus Azotimanducaceae bacterium]|jgi:general secretion pathway protein A